MSLFLLQPHVTGPEGQITTPDVIVDRVFVDGKAAPVGLLSHDCWQQTAPGETGHAGYAVMALGGGALILPLVILRSGPIVAARKAWRLNNLDGHVGAVTLNGVALSEIGLPKILIAAAGGSGDALPRGYLLVQTAPGDALTADLDDPKLGRSLPHRVTLESTKDDRWGDARPKPRYSVGPTQKDVPHFI